MIKQIQIEHMNREDLTKLLLEVLEPPPDPAIQKILKTTVDRSYIKRNLNISHRQILNYEEQGVLIPIKNGESASCSAYYRLADVLKLLNLKKL